MPKPNIFLISRECFMSSLLDLSLLSFFYLPPLSSLSPLLHPFFPIYPSALLLYFLSVSLSFLISHLLSLIFPPHLVIVYLPPSPPQSSPSLPFHFISHPLLLLCCPLLVLLIEGDGKRGRKEKTGVREGMRKKS